MATIDNTTYRIIRRLYSVDGMSQRQIAKHLNISRASVKKYCDGSNLPGIRSEYQIPKSPLRIEIEGTIVKIIEEHKDAPSKQKLNAKIIWQMLVKQGVVIGESTIRKYIQELRVDKPEVFIPLEFEPGEAMEFDWGDVYAFINGVKTNVSIFCAVLPYSYGIFVGVFPDKTGPSFFTGHVMAFEHFGGVPLRCIYDNLKSAVLEGSGKNAITQVKFKVLEAHYAFESVFCNAASGWEKGSVENLVSIVRKIAFTPMPHVENFKELQEHVTQKCEEYCATHKIRGRNRSIKEMLEDEKQHLLPLPVYPLDSSEEIKCNVYHDLTIKLNNVKYSVPKEYVGLSVTAKVSPFHIDIYYQGEFIYRHQKATNQGDHQYVLEHYLTILQEKPRALMNAAPIKSGIMPNELSDFLKLCKCADKNKQLIDLLLVLNSNVSSDNVLWAIKKANQTQCPTYEMALFYLNMQSISSDSKAQDVEIKRVDFNEYDQLLGGDHT